MKFCCVTPCLDAENLIEHTMESVLNQASLAQGGDELHYIVQDGGSSDSTVDIARSIAKKYKKCPNISLDIFSDQDQGMYDALAKGLQKFPAGDICSYLNAGDYYSPYAFEVVSELFTQMDVSFLTGLRCVYNDRNHLINCTLPYTYRKSLLLTGIYGTILPDIQQESTFWNFSFNRNIDFSKLRTIRLAGDYFLWKTFIRQAPLFIVAAHLGGFKIHKGQQSKNNRREYMTELRSLADKPGVLNYLSGYLDKIIWYSPNGVKKFFASRTLRYDHANSAYGP